MSTAKLRVAILDSGCGEELPFPKGTTVLGMAMGGLKEMYLVIDHPDIPANTEFVDAQFRRENDAPVFEKWLIG